MKKVFISQPMRGFSEEEILKAREEAKDHIKKSIGEDVEIINSYFENYNPSKGCIPLKYLAKSIDLLADADIIYMGKDWSKARGCMIEHTCARDYGITRIYAKREYLN